MTHALRSWRTTLVGIVGALALIGLQVARAVEGKPFDDSAIVVAVALLAIGALARDHDKTDQDHGLRPE